MEKKSYPNGGFKQILMQNKVFAAQNVAWTLNMGLGKQM